MGEGEPAALIIAVIALGVAVVAAVFSGWQAVTAHLARTSPGRARWKLEYPERAPGQVTGPWVLHNIGGSAATDVTITVVRSLAREQLTDLRLHVDGVIHASSSTKMRETETKFDPRTVYLPKADESGKWISTPADTPGARHMVDQVAMIEWKNYKGKGKRDRLLLW